MVNNKVAFTDWSRVKQLILIPETFLIYYIARNFQAGNSFNLVVTAVVGQYSCYPLILPAWRFWRETVLLLDVMNLEVNNERALLGKNFQLYNNTC